MSRKRDPLKDTIEAQAAERFVSQRSGEAAAAEERGLLDWLRQSPAHVAEYLGMAKLAKDMAGAVTHIDIPIEDLVAAARDGANIVNINADNLDGKEAIELRSRDHRTSRLTIFLGGALACLMIAAVGVGVARNWGGGTRYATAHGEERTWPLADGTVVHLNSDSKIRVIFNDHLRLVEVEAGQAYFEVAKDTARRFQVRVGDAILQDLGTSFDVFRKGDGTVVTVVEGQVAVWKADQLAMAAADSANLTALPMPIADLRAGDQATISHTGIVKAKKASSVRQATAWTRQEIVFDQESIADVVSEFNRYNDVQLRVTDPHIAALAISGIFHTYDVDSFIQFLNGLPSVEATTTGQVVTVKSKQQHLRG